VRQVVFWIDRLVDRLGATSSTSALKSSPARWEFPEGFDRDGNRRIVVCKARYDEVLILIFGRHAFTVAKKRSVVIRVVGAASES